MYTLKDVRNFRETRGKKRLILDTNLLLLLLVGACDINFINKIACTENYTAADYNLLVQILRWFDSKVVITPHIFTEFSNFSFRDIKEPRLSYYFGTVVDRLKIYREEYISLERLLDTKVAVLVAFGFSDISIIEAAKKIDAVILTDDIGLSVYANSCQIPNIRFGAVKANELLVQ